MTHTLFYGQAAANSFVVQITTHHEVLEPMHVTTLLEQHQADSFLSVYAPRMDAITVRVLERDGSESDLCGNGMRVVAKILADQFQKNSFPLHTPGGLCHVQVEGEDIAVDFPPLRFHGTTYLEGHTVFLMDVGEPHAILFHHELDIPLLQKLGPTFVQRTFLRGDQHSTYNLSMAVIFPGHCLQAQTFERGVCRLTEACGSGALAIASTYGLFSPSLSPITVRMPGGPLIVHTKTRTLVGSATFTTLPLNQ